MNIDAKPYAYPLGNKPPALIIIDMQKDFIEQGGFGSVLGNDVAPLKAIIPAVKQVLETFRRLQLPVIHTREAHAVDLSDCPPSKRLRGTSTLRIGDAGPMGRILVDGEPGNRIVDDLLPLHGEYEITKPGKGAFYASPLQRILTELEVSHVLFAGVTTEVCVQTSMREANDRGYECLLIEDATESYFPDFKQATLDMITAQGAIVGWTATSDRVMEGLQEAYGT